MEVVCLIKGYFVVTKGPDRFRSQSSPILARLSRILLHC